MLTVDDITSTLDGPLRSYRWRRVCLLVLVAQAWSLIMLVFVETLSGQEIDVEESCNCTVSVTSLSCGSCAAAGGQMRCTAPTTYASDFGLYCDRDWLRSLPPNAFIGGVGAGSFICSLGVVDRHGRRRTLVYAVTTIAVLLPLAALAPSFEIYLLLRLATGAAAMLGCSSGYTLAVELTGKQLRARLTSELACYFQPVWVMFIAMVCYALRTSSWRVQMAVVAVPYPFLAAGFAVFLPESPVWLMQHGDSSLARQVLEQRLGVAPIAADSEPTQPVDERATAPVLEGRRSSSSSSPPVNEAEVASSSGCSHWHDPVASDTHAVPNCPLTQLFTPRGGTGCVTLAQCFIWAAVALSYCKPFCYHPAAGSAAGDAAVVCALPLLRGA